MQSLGFYIFWVIKQSVSCIELAGLHHHQLLFNFYRPGISRRDAEHGDEGAVELTKLERTQFLEKRHSKNRVCKSRGGNGGVRSTPRLTLGLALADSTNF